MGANVKESDRPDPALPVRHIRRRLPRWSEVRDLLRFRRFELDGRRRRLARAHTIEDLRALARRRVPRAVFDYVDGAAEREITLGRARAAFEALTFHPRVLRDVSSVDASTEVLGAPAALPLVLAPTGFTRMMNHEGEPAVARAAARAGVPYALSTVGTTGPEELRSFAPDARHWFQLYVWTEREASEALVERVDAAGYEALMLTVDTPIGGARMRDVRNGLTIPPSLTLETFLGMVARPAWWFDVLTTEPLRFAALSSFDGTVEELIGRMFDPTLTFEALDRLRERWPRKLVVKGVQTVEDAVLLADRGVDAIVLSNHGGRQLDRTRPPLLLLPEVLEAVGDRCEVLIDGGVRSGADLAAARALGASAALVGRAYLYGLMAAGEPGVDRVLELLRGDYVRTLQLLGARSTGELGPEFVSLGNG